MLLLATPYTSSAYATSGGFVTLDESRNTLEDYQGSFLLIDAFATWCLPCETQMGYLKDVYDTIEDAEVEVSIISISFDPDDTVDKVTNFKEKFDAEWLFGFDTDSELDQYFQVEGYPTTFLLDQDGNILKKWLGLTDSEEILLEMDKHMELPGEFGRQLASIELVERLLDSPFFVFFLVFTWLLILLLILRIYRLTRKPIKERG